VGTKLVFLDRDGTLNVDFGYVHRIEDWQFTPQSPEALAMLQNHGFRLALVTNQSGVTTGRYSLADVDFLHQHIRQLLAMAGVSLNSLAVCPHSAECDCECRKPKTGLIQQIELDVESPIDYHASWTIGDKLSDVEFGHNLGTRTALLLSRYWSPGDLQTMPEIVADSLFHAAQQIVQRIRSDPA
jgi:D-glycero-D-manno-heptose 1,7-bisphosphate phosphatase